jgi:hypothetical protein
MKIIHFEELTLTNSDLDQLSSEEYAVLVGLAAVSDELRVFLNLLAQAESGIPNDENLKHAFRVQFFVLFRTMLSKAWEALRLLESSNTKLRRIDSKYADVFSARSGELRALKKNKHYKYTERIRNTASNHFDLDKLEDQLTSLSARGPLEVMLNKKRANTVYAFGDSLLQFAAMNAVYTGKGSLLEQYKSLGEWVNWSLDLSRFISEVTEAYIIKVLCQENSAAKWRKIHCYCEPEFAYSGDDVLPLFRID